MSAFLYLFFVLRRLIADTYPLFSLDFASKLRIIYVFFVKICLIKNFLLSLHPIWVHQRSARIHMYSYRGSDLRRSPSQERVRGIHLHIEKAFIDALLLAPKKLSTLFSQFIVKNKVTIDAYGYDFRTCPAVLGRRAVISA